MDLPLLPQPRQTGVYTDQPQGYRLMIHCGNVSIHANDSAGRFYAQQTLKQLRRIHDQSLPDMTVNDWPDFHVRGFMLDISRDKVPTMRSLFALVDQLAELKINQLQLYTEHTFAYREHEVVWKDASPMTAEEIRQVDQYCKDRFIELVPNQNSFGHLERWFKHPQYKHLAEKPDGFVFPSGKKSLTGFSLNPNDPRSLAFVENLYDELLPNFSSKLFNVGCDETFDVGPNREADYLNFVLKIYDAVKRRGRTMMFWGDIILNKPEMIQRLPRDLIALNWGYEADHPFENETAAFKDAGVPFYVCPGTSSWCSISGRTDNAIANLQNAAKWGLENRAAGYLITDWGDYGHLQYWPISLLGLAYGAAMAWCYESNRDLPIQAALDTHIFFDRAKVMGKLVYDFGNVYQATKKPLANGSRLFWALIGDEDRKNLYENVTIDEYADSLKRIESAIAPLDRAKMDRPDAELIRDEIRNAAAMLRYVCKPDAEDLRKIIAEHRRLWLARNRSGGLNDSAGRLERRLK